MQITIKQHIATVQLEALRQMRDELDEEISRLEQIVDPSEEVGSLPADGTFTAELTTAIHEILLKERPLHRQTILERLEDREIYVGGKDSLRTLSAYLSNDDRFVPAGKGEWTLAHPPSTAEVVEKIKVPAPPPAPTIKVPAPPPAPTIKVPAPPPAPTIKVPAPPPAPTIKVPAPPPAPTIKVPPLPEISRIIANPSIVNPPVPPSGPAPK